MPAIYVTLVNSGSYDRSKDRSTIVYSTTPTHELIMWVHKSYPDLGMTQAVVQHILKQLKLGRSNCTIA
jgi:hypothetical protein